MASMGHCDSVRGTVRNTAPTNLHTGGARTRTRPRVQVVEVFPTVSHLAVLEFEDNAVDVEALAVLYSVVEVHGDHAALVIGSDASQFGLEVPPDSCRYRPNWVNAASRPTWSPAMALRPGMP